MRYEPAHDEQRRKRLDSAYVNAMARVYERFPDDPDVGTLYAESMMLLLPRRGTWDMHSPPVHRIHTVLEAVLSAVPVEGVSTMMYETSGPYALTEDPPVWAEYRRTMAAAGVKLALAPLEKWDFYAAVATDDHVLTIQTADQQRFANVLLTIGVRMD